MYVMSCLLLNRNEVRMQTIFFAFLESTLFRLGRAINLNTTINNNNINYYYYNAFIINLQHASYNMYRSVQI